MNKKLTDYVIDLVEILNKQQKQVFWGIFDILSMVVSIIVSYILFYGLFFNDTATTEIYTKQFLSLIIIKILAIKAGFKAISNAEQNIVLTAQNGEQTRLRSKSKDDDDVIEEILIYLRKLNKGRAEK